MAPPFQPGFRISLIDKIVVGNSILVAMLLWTTNLWLSLGILFVVAHFFLFCNVFRIARKLELAWAGIFICLACGTIAYGLPTWSMTILATLCVTVVVIAIEMRKPSYHGILWQRINPQLPQWWAERSSAREAC